MPQHRSGAVGRAYHLAVVERLEKRIKELESRQVSFMDAEGEAVRIRIDSPHASRGDGRRTRREHGHGNGR